MRLEKYPQAAQIIQDNTYMDDIIESTDNLLTAQKITKDIENLISRGGFQVKGWIFSDNPRNQEKTTLPTDPNTSTVKVLGIVWNPVKDYLIYFEVKLDFSRKKHKLCTGMELKMSQLPSEIPEQHLWSTQISGTFHRKSQYNDASDMGEWRQDRLRRSYSGGE